MANPRRNTQSSENPFHAQTLTSSSVTHFLKKPHAFPFLLSIFLFLTWVSLRLQHSSSPSRFSINRDDAHKKWSQSSDSRANLVRFGSGFPSPIAKDKRGWFLDPISLAKDSRISGGALSCVSLHLGEIRPGGLRGNHRHHSCNETFVIWGAETRFRVDEGYAEVTIGADEVAVAASPSSTAHALINIDPVRTTYFIGCQDRIINYNSSSTDFNVWKNLSISFL
ncbi:uncharacterized protein LOC126594320 isoform X2 [Malus sylvestris]|uniref:uncharacterized protein isoform X2 n=1 Tax=Malus domestica TaxID=3750 RepID=UPI0010AA6770|nr:uncharacterized protein LOC103449060 isoform X2 [Malus domestica]XP_050116520.1 uncharacterized protein LOC126594320 isoform X2 [Malus sylvestris]